MYYVSVPGGIRIPVYTDEEKAQLAAARDAAGPNPGTGMPDPGAAVKATFEGYAPNVNNNPYIQYGYVPDGTAKDAINESVLAGTTPAASGWGAPPPDWTPGPNTSIYPQGDSQYNNTTTNPSKDGVNATKDKYGDMIDNKGPLPPDQPTNPNYPDWFPPPTTTQPPPYMPPTQPNPYPQFPPPNTNPPPGKGGLPEGWNQRVAAGQHGFGNQPQFGQVYGQSMLPPPQQPPVAYGGMPQTQFGQQVQQANGIADILTMARQMSDEGNN